MQSFLRSTEGRLAATVRRLVPGGRRRDIAAAVCFRWEADELRFGLVSTRDGQRWTFPKGHREPGESLASAAAREAGEEAGVEGIIDRRRLLAYRYPGRAGAEDDLVSAFLLHVTRTGGPAESFRRQEWCDEETARRRLAENRDPFHARELERVLGLAVTRAGASRAGQRSRPRAGG
jgi:8-oxo-dGTP pyrophosphatase MutT (NUDIX family)